uniref:DUF2834 domain-containing protein n=1 Tax=uncultured Thiotrichaceae bacterium TaxID=298394 RepID=A0A6S6UNX6_9GAMM|nr:MAG: Unknown protein [uncultured Thiotrichaceae bacterium]
MKLIYGVLCVLGLVIPMWQFIPWFMEHGFDLVQFLNDASATRLATFAWADVLLTSVALLVFIVVEGGGRLRMSCILPGVIATFLVGPSLGLPLFLYLREVELNRKTA